MQTEILAPGTTAADSDFIVITDSPKLVSVLSAEIGARVGQSYMELWQRCIDGSSQRVQYRTPQGTVIVPRLDGQNRQMGLYLPGVYFLRRPAQDDAIGAELGDTDAADNLIFVDYVGTLDVAYDGNEDLTSSLDFGASGGTGPYTFVATGLPTHLTLSAAGVLQGDSTAAAAGIYTVTVTATDSAAHTGKLIVQIAVPEV